MRRFRQIAILLWTVVGGAVPLASAQDMSTWQTIQSHILNGNCTSCHQSGTGFAQQSGLILTDDLAYEQLVNTAPKNFAALEDGLLRVSSVGGMPGLEQSFLWEKINAPEQAHFYDDHPNYGAIMPLGGQYLTNGQLDFIESWILNGAPQTGVVADPALLDDMSRYEPPPFRPLDPPEQGIQLHIGPYDVWSADRWDREFYYFQPYQTDEDLFVKRYEVSYREGSHHFILFNYPEGTETPTPEVYRDIRSPDGTPDDSVNNEISGLFPFRVVTLSQTPYSNYSLPPKVALRLPPGAGFDLNVHSVNRTGQVQPGEVYVNLHTVDREDIDHVAEYTNFSNYNIFLPPHQETTLSKEFEFTETQNILQMWSHAHEHMTEFRIEFASGERDGELIYWTNDWQHPPILEFDTPLTFKRGEKIRLVTTYNNTTDKAITFGPLSSDEMQFLFYIQYPGSLIAGDFDEDLQLTVDDIDRLSQRVRQGAYAPRYDVNFDNVVDQLDRVKWVERLADTYFGDSNLDGVFDTADMVEVFQAGQYEDAVARNSSWATGDWDGDGDFGTGDLVLAFSAGGYERGPRATQAVPEPRGLAVLLLGMFCSWSLTYRGRSSLRMRLFPVSTT
jgi:hypothetical protein